MNLELRNSGKGTGGPMRFDEVRRAILRESIEDVSKVLRKQMDAHWIYENAVSRCRSGANHVGYIHGWRDYFPDALRDVYMPADEETARRFRDYGKPVKWHLVLYALLAERDGEGSKSHARYLELLGRPDPNRPEIEWDAPECLAPR